jgi:hypothetical protein
MFKIGDKVIINGGLYVSSMADKPTSYVTNRITYITRIANGSKHPYNTTGDLGWMNECDIKLYEEPSPEPEPVDKYTCEMEVIDNDGLLEYLKDHKNKVIVIDSEDLKKVLGL